MRSHQAVLKESANRLQLALDGAELGVWSLDIKTGRFESDARDCEIHDYRPDHPPKTVAAARSFIHRNDLPTLDAAFSASKRTGGRCKVEYRLAPAFSGALPPRERWAALEGTIVRDARSRPVQLLGVTRNISESKQAELDLAERTMQLDLAGKVALVGTFTFNIATGRIQVSPGYATIHGLPEGTEDSSRADWRARVHPDDLARLETRLAQTVAARRHDHHCDYRIVRPDGKVRWIESRSFISYDERGPRLVGANIDVTDRKRAELALDERNMQLALAGRAAGVGSYAYDFDADVMQITEGYAALHGLPEGTTETTRSQWRARAHPEDLVHVEAARRQALRERREEHSIDFRVVLPGGEMRWIESRSFISYNEDGRPRRVIGLHIDVTERRRADDHQRTLIAELDHRVKNVLASVVAIIAQTQEGHQSLAAYTAALELRIKALSRTHELLSQNRWAGVSLHDVVQCEFAPYEASKVEIDGPHVELKPEAAQAMAMVVHELTTNAAKYGALSTRSGRVRLSWGWLRNGSSGWLAIDWQEVGGPPLQAPGQAGYGTTIVNELVPYELNGTVALDFAPEGLRCSVEIPPECISAGRPLPSPSPSLHLTT
jgi:PAS domain S-box-containing protein